MFENHQFCLIIDDMKMLVNFKADPWHVFDIMGEYIDHFDLYSLDEKGQKSNQPNPMTKTGYRSINLNRGFMQEFTSPAAFLIKAVESQANSPEWKENKDKARQLKLF